MKKKQKTNQTKNPLRNIDGYSIDVTTNQYMVNMMKVKMADKVFVSVHRDKGKEGTQGNSRHGRTKDKHTGNLVSLQEGK